MLSEELRNKIIKEQDLYFDSFATEMKDLYGNQKSDIEDDILKDEKLLNEISFNNLGKLFEQVSKKNENFNRVREIVSERVDKEDNPAVDENTVSIGLQTIYLSHNLAARMGNDILIKLADKLKKTTEPLKGEKGFDKIIAHLKTVNNAANFAKAYNEGIITDEKKAILEKMIDKKENALLGFNYNLLKDEIYNSFDERTLECISNFPNITNKLVLIQENNPQLFEVIKERGLKEELAEDNLNKLETLVNGFSKACYDVKDNELTEEKKDNLEEWATFIKRFKTIADMVDEKLPRNYSDDYFEKVDAYYKEVFENSKDKINSLYESKPELKTMNLDEVRKKKEELDKIFATPDGWTILEEWNKYVGYESDLEEIENAKAKENDIYFRMKYRMSKADAQKMYNEYATDLDSIENIDKEKEFFNELNQDLSKEDGFENIFEDGAKKHSLREIESVKTSFVKQCSKTYSDEFNKTDKVINEKIQNSDYKTLDYNGQEVKMVELNGKFDMLLHCTKTNFLGDQKLDKDFSIKKFWDESQDKTDHIMSTFYSSNSFVGGIPQASQGAMLGFTSVQREKIRIVGSSDINTYNRQLSYDSTTKHYVAAKNLPKNARRVYPETSMEKTNPDFVVLYDDTIYDENLTYENETPEEIEKRKSITEFAKKTAVEFGIPIVYIDKKEIVKEQIENLNNKIEEFSKEKNPEMLREIICEFETNNAGWLLNRKAQEDESHTKDVNNERFAPEFNEIGNKIQDTIYSYLDEVKNDPEKTGEELMYIATSMLEEKEKYERSIEAGPDGKITGTEMKLDSKTIVEKLNVTMKEKGMDDKFQILEDTNLKQYLSLRDAAKYYTCVERVGYERVSEMDRVEEKNRDEQKKENPIC